MRFAADGETVETLDDVERRLNPADVLIVDDVATAAIGGVMGSGSTEMRDDSTDVLLEAAVWDPAAVSRTARRLHLPSEAARRYEREVDPAISVAALDRCAALLADIAGGEVSAKITDWRGDPPRRRTGRWATDPARRRPAGPHGRGELPPGHDGPAVDPDRRRGQRCRRQPDRHAAELAARSVAAGRLGRGGAATGGSGCHSVGAAVGAGRPWTVGDAAPPPRHRQVAGAVRLRRDPSDAVPARRRFRRLGPARRRRTA